MPETEALIVDDSMSARFALNRSLQAYQMNVTQAKTGEEGVATASERAFDVIFMDHVLPGIDGLQAMEQIRAMPQHASTPIFMCTSNDTPDYREEAVQRGASDVLCKPPDEHALSALLSTRLNAKDSDSVTDIAESSEENSQMSNDQQIQAIDQRLDRLEAMLERLETTVSQMDNRTKAVARAIADQAGRDLSNRLLRAVLSLKGK